MKCLMANIINGFKKNGKITSSQNSQLFKGQNCENTFCLIQFVKKKIHNCENYNWLFKCVQHWKLEQQIFFLFYNI